MPTANGPYENCSSLLESVSNFKLGHYPPNNAGDSELRMLREQYPSEWTEAFSTQPCPKGLRD